MRLQVLALGALVSLVSVVGCNSLGPKGPLTVPLSYRPTDLPSGTQSLVKGNISVSVTDERVNKQAIGQNVEKTAPVSILTNDDPAQFVANVLKQQLQARGANLVAKGDKNLTLHLTTFWTDEENTYKCQVSGRAEITDSSGKALWEGIASGSSERFGRSLSAENYQECFSDAALKLATSLLSDPGMSAALK